jgi:uncharacterized membrane protein (DUF106 family)
MNKEGSFRLIFIVMIISLIIVSLWDKVPIIKDTVHAILDPTAGVLLDFNVFWGMLIIVSIISLIVSLTQKYGTDQETLRELKKEQKILQEEMKKFKENPQKLLELQKKQFEFIPKTMKLTMRPIIYTGIPLLLFFRWFNDYFTALGGYEFFGFMSWIWFYLLFSILFSSVFRKLFKIA